MTIDIDQRLSSALERCDECGADFDCGHEQREVHRLRREVAALRAEPEPPPIPEGCTWDGDTLRQRSGRLLYIDHDGDVEIEPSDRHTYLTASELRFLLWQHDRAQAGGEG